jgi:hypothetical protein
VWTQGVFVVNVIQGHATHVLLLHRKIKNRQHWHGRIISQISNNIIPGISGWQQQDIGMIAGTGIGIKGSKRKNIFIKNDIP